MKLRRHSSEDEGPNLPLETPRLFLRDFMASDLERVHAYASREEVARYMIWGPNNVAQTADAIEGFVEDAQERPRLSYDLAIVLKTNRLLIGGVGLRISNVETRLGDIGYVLHPEYWGMGYAMEASRALLHMGFEGLGLRRIVGYCDQRNKGSARVMEKLGMRREGALKASKLIQGQWRDEYLYAILAEEFSRG